MKNIWDTEPKPKSINKDIKVCWDADANPENPKDRHVVVWAEHNKDWDEEKYPYLLSIKDARKLRDWLNNFLFEVGG